MALPVADDPTQAIREMAQECIQRFESIEANCGGLLSRKISSGIYFPGDKTEATFTFSSTRQDFDSWIAGTGILSPKPWSLDFQTEGSEFYSQFILRHLGRMSESLASVDNPSTIPSVISTPDFIETFEYVTESVREGVDLLRRVANQLRNLRTRNVQEISMARFDNFTDDDFIFRDYITHLIRRRFLGAGAQLHSMLGESIAIRRRRLLDKCLHTSKIAIRRASRNGPLVEEHGEEMLPNAPLGTSRSTQERAPDHPGGSGNGAPEAFRPDTQDERFKPTHLPKTEALSLILGTHLLSKAESFEYPPIPVTANGQTRIQCPFCSDELELGSDASKAWKDHIRKDLTPYPCLLPECAAGLTFFETRIEWKAHMSTRHYPDWIRKVVPKWYCSIDHDQLQTFQTEREWREHMRDSGSHYFKRKRPTEAQLDQLAREFDEMASSREFLCPLCRRVPTNVEGKDSTSSTMANDLLLDHILNHLESLSLQALPPLSYPRLVGFFDGQQPGNPRQPTGERVMDRLTPPHELKPLSISDAPTFVREFIKSYAEIKKTRFCLTKCECCGQDAIEGAIPLHEAARFLTFEEIDSFTKSDAQTSSLRNCPCCGQDANKGDLTSDQIKSSLISCKVPLSRGFSHPRARLDPGIKHRVPGWFNIWASWLMRRDSYARMDPILFCLTHPNLLGRRATMDEFANVWSIDRKLLPFPTDGWMGYRGVDDEAVHDFLKKWANVYAVDHHGMTPLLWAAVLGHEEMVRILLRYNAEIEKGDKTFNRTPLSLAALGGHKGIVDILLKAGANVHSCDSSNRTPLFWAVYRGHTSVMKSLLAFGARYQDSGPLFPMSYSSSTYNSVPNSAIMHDLWSSIQMQDIEAMAKLLDQYHQHIHEFHIYPGKTILDLAVETDELGIAQTLMHYDAQRLQHRSLAIGGQLLKRKLGSNMFFLESNEFTL